MAKPTVYINDYLLERARVAYERQFGKHEKGIGTSMVVSWALLRAVEQPSRPDLSERGRLETLAVLRAARAALDDLEGTLTQDRPVKRHARRIR